MNHKPAIGIGIAAVLAALGLAAWASDSSRNAKPVAVDAQEYADFMAHEALDVRDLAEDAELQRRAFNRMTPPGLAWVQPAFPLTVPFDAANFDEKFIDELLGEDRNSVAVYPLTLALDPKTRETLIYNAEGKPLAALPSEKTSRTWPEGSDPARVVLRLDLLPAEDVEQYLYTENRIAETFAVFAKSKPDGTGGIALRSLGGGEFGIADVRRLSNGTMRITVSNGTGVAELYSYTVLHTSAVVVTTWTNDAQVVITDTNTLWYPVSPSFDGIESEWACGTTNLVLTNGVAVWEDASVASNARIRFYAAAKRTDFDVDGLTDGAEILLHRTDPANDDTDGDGLRDGWEVNFGLDPLDDGSAGVVNGADGDPDGDGLRNLDEYLRGLNPVVADWPVTLHVDGATGDDQTGNGSTNAPYRTIARAVQVGRPYEGCIVWIAGGVYEDFPLTPLYSGTQLRAVTGQTVNINGSIYGGLATNVQLHGLTVDSVSLWRSSVVASKIRGGRFTVEDTVLDLRDAHFEGYDSGLDCTGTSAVTVVNGFFTACENACSLSGAAGLRLLNSILVRNCRGIFGGSGTLDVNHCVVAYNRWLGISGGFDMGISNSVIWQNNVDFGGDGRIRNCAFAWPQEANTNGNVQVADPGWINTALNNYRLRSDSPLINQGGADNTVDLDGEVRPFGAASDIGVDEMRDADADGLADHWEQTHNATNPVQNLDGDAMNNLEEYRRGFNPRATDGPVTVHVNVNGSDETGVGSQAYPFATIGKGLDWASARGGGTVIVPAGDWSADPFEMRDEVTLKGAGPSASKLFAWWCSYLGEDPLIRGARNVGIEDFTVENCGLDAWLADNVSLKRIRVEGQLMLRSVNKALLEDVEVSHSYDNGMEFWISRGLTLNRCRIHDSNGSGIHVYPPLADTVVSNTVIAHNKGHGIDIDALWSSNAVMAIRHSVVAFNRDTGINWNGPPSNASVRNSILWHNGPDLHNLNASQVQYCDVSDQNLGGTGNLYGVWPRWVNSDAGNFHLLTNSPMRNKGINLAGSDIDNEVRPVSGSTDIGVDQAYFSAGSWFPSWWTALYGNLPPLADADGDGLTNYEEFRNNTNPNSGDTDGDGASDYQEVWQAGNPCLKADGGQPPPSNEVAYLNLEIGDTSGSMSEKYMLEVGSVCLRMTGYGGSTNRVVPFRVGREYVVRILHLGSVTNPPDLDYVIDVSPAPSSNGPTVGVLRHDPAGLLNGGSDLAASFFTNEVSIVIFKMNMTAYRPRTEGPGTNNPFARHAVPEDLEESPGAGIRVNGDDDNGNGTADRLDTTVNNENDTIEVVLQAEPFSAPGLVYALKRSNSNSSIKVWTTQNKSQALLGSNHETNLAFTSTSKTVWVECPTGGVADLEFEARTTNGTLICEDKVHFFGFTGIAIGLSGHVWWGSPQDNGMYSVSTNLYQDGYDVHFYDEATVNGDGSGVPYSEVTNAIRSRAVVQVAIFGHSHGGGATRDVSQRLNDNRATIGTFTIPATVYVDAIVNTGLIPTASETNLPPGTLYHVNYYQTNDSSLVGAPVPGAATNLNVNSTTWGANLNHTNIDNDTNVIQRVVDQIRGKLTR
ncbi:MAG: right-handed parallel beta-helix repeat-containing protein [Kiritimatiellia bacterium]